MSVTISIQKTDRIVTAFAEAASGPGWSNRPLWVVVQRVDCQLRLECIQPADQTTEMHLLFDVSRAAHEAMKAAVETVARK